MRTPERWDIFCRVVDNFGDAGVCWRLARQLAHEHRFNVRFRIDDLASLARLEPAVVDAPRQTVDGVEVVRWDRGGETDAPDGIAPDVVIEGFGCGLSESYVEAIASARRPPLWIVLEYLSAEPWVPEHHGLPSPHPRWPLERYFFFPGFVRGTGGLLREESIFRRRDAFGEAQRDAFWRSVGHAPAPREATAVSLFAYESAPVAELLRHWEHAAGRTIAAVPDGRLLPEVLKHFGLESVPANRLVRRGPLEVRIVPFVPQARFDELLWSCDVNFVRGEDSFVRAQWAARAFIWQIYPQEALAHSHKLEAFLDLYCDGLPERATEAARTLMRVWNRLDGGAVTPGAAWDALSTHSEVLRRHASAWAGRIAAIGDLADNLASFCLDKLK
jgi:uncharacterized repeat protein (TIGR03837 family)